MKTTTKYLMVLILLLLVGLTTVSATENTTDSSQTTDFSAENDITNENIITDTTQDNNNIQNSENKDIKKNNEQISNIKPAKTASTITITNNTYDYFFEPITNKEFVKTTDMIKAGDTINLKGNFYNLKFAVDKQLTFTSIDSDAYLYNSTVYILGQDASGSVISNLHIENNGTLKKGIQVKNAGNVTVENNYISADGVRAYAFVGDNMNNSIIKFNTIKRYGDDWRHIAFIIGNSHYNTIANNTIECGDANGIYLSIYGSDEANFDGGHCDYNNITGNKVTAKAMTYESITSWCYTIQVMGAHNIVSYNNVSGGYRGISSQDFVNNTIINNEVDALFEGIYACENAIVSNNTVHVSESSRGITVGGEGVTVSNNTITSIEGPGIDIGAGNTLIANNTITSTADNGIYSKGQYTNITIDNNKINSEKEGILFKYQTRTKKINHVLVTKNTIVSNAEYAIDFEQAGAWNAADVNVTVAASNVLTSSRGKGLQNAYRRPSNTNESSESDSNLQFTIDSTNYNQYFNNGVAIDEIKQNSTVQLIGQFNDCNFIFNKKVHIIGDNCLIKHGTITLTGDAHESTIENVKINNTNNDDVTRHAIEIIEVNNCILTDITIDNYGEYEGLGIFLFGANGNTIRNSKIRSSGDYINNAILCYGSDSNTIENNNISLNQTDLPTEYADSLMFNEMIGTITEVLHNHGIILLYSSDNTINKNKINVTSLFDSYTFPTNDCKNSVVGIDMYFGCHNNKVTNNRIDIKSFGPYVYGMGVLGGNWGSSITALNATNNQFKYNNLTVEGGYYATGFIAGRNSVNTLVESNKINVKAINTPNIPGDNAEGVVLENSTRSTIIKNTITTDGLSVYNIELYDSSYNNITNNTINSRATHPNAIAGYRSSYNNITYNNMQLRKVYTTETTEASHSDVIPSEDEAIMFMSSSTGNNVKYNTINTNATATMKLTGETRNNIVQENSLVAKGSQADQSVINLHTSNIVSNNFVHFVNVTVTPLTAYIGDTVTINATITSTTTDLTNLTATFILGTNTIGTSSITNGVARLTYNISTLYRPTVYQISVSVEGNNFQNKTGIAQATFDKHPEKTVVKVAKILTTPGHNVTLTANITTATGGKIGVGQAEFYCDNVKLSTVDVNLGVASLVYPVAANAEVKLHTIKVMYLANHDYENSTGTNILGVQSVSNVAVANYTATIGQNMNIKANVTSGTKKVSTGTVNILINNIAVDNATISNGVATKTVKIPTSFDKGTYNLKIVYPGNDTQAPASATAKITLNPITPVFHYNKTSVVAGGNISIVLTLDNGFSGDSYCPANNGNVSLKLNNQTLTDAAGNIIKATVNNGMITFQFTVPTQLVGKNNLTFIYSGDNKFAQGERTYTDAFSVQKADTNLYMYTRNGDEKGSTIKVSGKLQSYGNEVKGETVTIKVNGKTYTATTGGYGYFTVNHTITSYDDLNVTFTYSGSSSYKGCSNSTVYTVKKPSNLYMYTRSGDAKGSTIKVSGKLQYNNGEGATGEKVTIKVNSKTYTATTGGYGYFTVNHTITSYDDLNVTFTYAGGKNYEASTNSTIYKVNDPTSLFIYSRTGDKKGSTIKVSGKLLCGDEGVKGEKVTIKVNGKTYTATTGGYGYFTVNHTITSYDDLNISMSYAGSSKYESTTNSTVYKVNGPTSLFIYSRSGDAKGSTIKVSGKLLCGDEGVKGEKVTIKVNGKTFTATTGGYGYFTINYTITSYDDLNISMSYAGSSKYEATTNSTVYKVKQPTNLYMYARSGDKVGTTIKVSGKLQSNGEGVKGEKVNINVNGKTYTATTAGYGYFTVNYTITSNTNCNVTFTYNGSKLYEASTNSTVYTVKA